MVAYVPLLIQAYQVFKFVLYILIFLCCVKYLKK